MKVRKGFVSNSSTSSFMAIFEGGIEPDIMADRTYEEIALLEQTITRHKLGSREIVMFYIDSGEYAEFELDLEKFTATTLELAKIGNEKSELESTMEEYGPEEKENAISECYFEASESLERMFRELEEENNCIIISKYY